jgi:Cathepsin propeptide inhibitor domain (I29)
VAMSSVISLDAKSSVKHTNVFVDSPLDAFAGDCHSYATKDACTTNNCYWCKSAAVRSMCYTEQESQQLPPGVFECDKKEKISWEVQTLPSDPLTWHALFSSWKLLHRKHYASALEEQVRRAVFEANARTVVAHNRDRNATFTMELNQFADLTWSVTILLLYSTSSSHDAIGTSLSSGTLVPLKTVRPRTPRTYSKEKKRYSTNSLST